MKLGQDSCFSFAHLEGEIAPLDLTEHYRSFAAPVVFLLGRYDRHIPSELAEQYFSTIHGRASGSYGLNGPGITRHSRRPQKFNAVMIDEVVSLVTDGCAQ